MSAVPVLAERRARSIVWDTDGSSDRRERTMATRRAHVTVRTHGLDWMAKRAQEEGLTRTKDGEEQPNVSEFIRLCLAYAHEHMPKGWRPAGWDPNV